MGNELITIGLYAGLVFCGVILLAFVVKLVELRRASRWPSTTGTVIKSRLRSRKRYDIDHRSSFITEAWITYEYEVGGRLYRSSQLSLGERTSDADMGAALQRSPVGKAVQVYYNPDDPGQAVLERELPPVVVKGIGLLLLFLGAAVLIPRLVLAAADWLAPRLPDPERALASVILAGIGIGISVVALGLQRQVRASQHWLSAPGQILAAQAEEFQSWASRDSSRGAGTLFYPSVVYKFQVDGGQVISDRVSFGWDMGWPAERFFQKRLERYPEDSLVTVYYNPLNPAECVLERRAAGLPVLWGCAVVIIALAVIFSGLI